MQRSGRLSQWVTSAWARYQSSNLLKSSSWYAVSLVIERGVSFLGILIFTRLMTQAEYGTVALFTSWYSIFNGIITLNVSASITNAQFDFPEDQFPGYVSSILTLGMLTSAAVFVLLWLLPETWIQTIFNLDRVFLLIAVGLVTLGLSTQTMLEVWQVQYHYRARAVLKAAMAIVRMLLSVALILSPFVFQNAADMARVVGIALVAGGVGGVLLLRILLKGRRFIDWTCWRYALRFGLPLIPHMIMSYVIAHSDRVLIDRYVGRAETGLYTFAYQLGEIAMLVKYATDPAWVPWFYRQMEKGSYAHIRRRSSQYIMGYFVLIVGLILAAPLVVRILSATDFIEAAVVVPIVMGGLFFTFPINLYTNIARYDKRTEFISLGTVVAAVINFGLNVLLLPRFGYIAAAWTTLIAYMVLFLFSAYVVRYQLKSPLRYNFWLMLLLGICVICIAVLMYTIN